MFYEKIKINDVDNDALKNRIIRALSEEKFVLPEQGYFKDYYSGWDHYGRILGHAEQRTTEVQVEFGKDNDNFLPHRWPEFAPVMAELNKLTNNAEVNYSWIIVMCKGSILHSHSHPRSKQLTTVYTVAGGQDDIFYIEDGLPLEPDTEWEKVKLMPNDLVIMPKWRFHRMDERVVDEVLYMIIVDF